MIALNIPSTRAFMRHFLVLDTFDKWCLSEGSLTTFCTYTIDGAWQRDFFDPDGTDALQDRKLAPWGHVREFCFSLIKGKHTPLAFKFVFVLPEDEVQSFLASSGLSISPDEIGGLFLNISFRNKKLMLTTGTALRAFTMDRSVDSAWDAYVRDFLKKCGIEAEDA
ncbi:MAG: DUF5721 family protein [Lachnospiraceae bacterium]|nr:DUF5721 family protein [Lachnospiraceae bacterium]